MIGIEGKEYMKGTEVKDAVLSVGTFIIGAVLYTVIMIIAGLGFIGFMFLLTWLPPLYAVGLVGLVWWLAIKLLY